MFTFPQHVEREVQRVLQRRAMDIVAGGIPATMTATAHAKDENMFVIKVLYKAAVIRDPETDLSGELIWIDSETGKELKSQALSFSVDEVRQIMVEQAALGAPQGEVH